MMFLMKCQCCDEIVKADDSHWESITVEVDACKVKAKDGWKSYLLEKSVAYKNEIQFPDMEVN